MKPATQMALAGGGFVLFLVFLMVDGTQKVPDESPFVDDREYEIVVVVAIDLSGSYLPLLADQGRAWEFLQRVLDRYMRGNGRQKLVIVQLSGNRDVLIFDGTPDLLRREFPTPAEFKAFLHKRADPNGSRLTDGMTDAINYSLNIPGLTPQSKVITLFLTDYEDNLSAPGGEGRLMQAIGSLGKRPGSAVGFYFVTTNLVEPLRGAVRATGIKNFAVYGVEEREFPLPNID